MSNDNPSGWFQDANLALGTFAGATLAHEVGHIVGFQHTRSVAGTIASYNECELDLRYPSFGPNDQVVDGDTVYQHADWFGRVNIMSPFTVEHLFNIFQLGIFRANYEEIFENILNCWFERSTVSE